MRRQERFGRGLIISRARLKVCRVEDAIRIFHHKLAHAFAILAREMLRLLRLVHAIKRDPASRSYADLALTPGGDDEESLDLLTKTTGVQAAMAHAKKVAELTGHAA